MSSLKRWLDLVKEAGSRWSNDQCLRLGASFSYYAVFSIFPLLLLSVTSVGFIIGHDASVRDRMLNYVAQSGAPEMRPLLEETLSSMQQHATARGVGAIVGFISLLVGASGVFSELQATLNTIWLVKAPPTASFWAVVLTTVKDKALSFVVVIGAGAALFVSLLLSAALSTIDATASRVIKTPIVWLLLESVVSIALLTGLISAIYQMIPRTKVAWRDVFGGALLSALLFTLLKRLFAWYLGHIGSYAAYGAVGGVLGLLAWIYLASLVLFLGAEFTRVYAESFGSLKGTVSAASEPALGNESGHVERRAGDPGSRPEVHAFFASPVGGEGEGRKCNEGAPPRRFSSEAIHDSDVAHGEERKRDDRDEKKNDVSHRGWPLS